MELIRSEEGYFEKNKPIEQVMWPFFDLLVVEQGAVNVTIYGQKHLLIANTCVLIYPHTVFSVYAQSTRCKASVYHFSLAQAPYHGSWSHLNALSHKNAGAKYFRFGANSQLSDDLKRVLGKEQVLANADHNAALASSLFSVVLLQLCHQRCLPNASATKHHGALDKLVQRARLDSKTNWSIEQMACTANLSSSHFRELFKQVYGQAPLHYFRQIKINHACRLLTQTALPIKAISLTLGYDGLSPFYRHFKQCQGVTPAVYRATHASNHKFY